MCWCVCIRGEEGCVYIYVCIRDVCVLTSIGTGVAFHGLLLGKGRLKRGTRDLCVAMCGCVDERECIGIIIQPQNKSKGKAHLDLELVASLALLLLLSSSTAPSHQRLFFFQVFCLFLFSSSLCLSL